jgi:hypothetical protein
MSGKTMFVRRRERERERERERDRDREREIERERERERRRCPGGMSGFNIWIIYLALKDTSPCRESEMGEMEENKICRP